LSGLGDVLVVTVRKSFWASPEAERWPRRVYAHVLYGHSTNVVNSALVFARALATIWLRPPRLVLLGSVERTVPWFVRARQLGLLRGARLVVTNQLNLAPSQLEQIDRVIVYASAEAAALGDKGIFLRLPADGDFEAARRAAEPNADVFSGGSAGRDFATLLEAVRGTDIRLDLVVFTPDKLRDLPPNVEVIGPVSPQAFLERMADAKVVVVPVLTSDSPHGQTTLVQALALGKPVVATRSVGIVDYVEDGEEGLLVDPGDAVGLRGALLRILGDDELRARSAERARTRSNELSYRWHAEQLTSVCNALL
jgi:glycosyltransferase involved in cell wall biosynthesis